MKFTLDWLQTYLNTDGLSPELLADHLTMLGLEVDTVLPLYEDLAPLRTGEILTAEKLANADKLHKAIQKLDPKVREQLQAELQK